MYLPPFPILGGLLAWATFYFLGFKRQMWAELILGGVAFILAMAVQNPIQGLPLLGMGIRSNADILARGTAFTLGVAIWIGIVAGFVQEGVKYFFVRRKGFRAALFIGLGFGVTEALFVAVTPIVVMATTGGKPDVPAIQAILSMVERYFAVLFHVGTAVYLARSAWRGLLKVAILHGFVDTLATCGQLLTLKSGELGMKFTIGLEAVFAVIAIVLIAYTLPLARNEEEERAIW